MTGLSAHDAAVLANALRGARRRCVRAGRRKREDCMTGRARGQVLGLGLDCSAGRRSAWTLGQQTETDHADQVQRVRRSHSQHSQQGRNGRVTIGCVTGRSTCPRRCRSSQMPAWGDARVWSHTSTASASILEICDSDLRDHLGRAPNRGLRIDTKRSPPSLPHLLLFRPAVALADDSSTSRVHRPPRHRRTRGGDTRTGTRSTPAARVGFVSETSQRGNLISR